MIWFCLSRRHSAAWKASALCWEYALTARSVPPTIASLYNNPALFANYPFHADILQELENASVRPKTPLYQVVSIDISHLISPPSGINPTGTERSMISQLNNALQSKGLVP